MHARRILLAATAVAMTVTSLTIATATPASAAATVICGNIGPAGGPNHWNWMCDLSGVGARNELWTGLPVTSGQGTSEAIGTCIMVPPTHPYYPTVQYVNTATGQSVTSTAPAFLCNGESDV
jgi:hypothetical protein